MINSLPPKTLELMKRHDELKEQIQLRWTTFSKAKSDYSELAQIESKLKSAKIKWRGIEVEEVKLF